MKTTNLYKRDAKGNILEWTIKGIGEQQIEVLHGVLNGKLQRETLNVTKRRVNEVESRIKAKRKEGYKALEDLYDSSPVEGNDMNSIELYNYLNTYLPKYNTTDEGFVLPMLAKTLEDNKPFEKIGDMLGQWKINGLRCIVGAEKAEADLFKPIRLTYISREGTRWNLPWMDDIILPNIGSELLDMMVEGVASLDGELYLPGYSVNDINSFVKNPSLGQHYLLQYWCYDVCVEAFSTIKRNNILRYNVNADLYANLTNKEQHLSNELQFLILPSIVVPNIQASTTDLEAGTSELPTGNIYLVYE